MPEAETLGGLVCPACGGERTQANHPPPWIWCHDCGRRWRGKSPLGDPMTRLRQLQDWLGQMWMGAADDRARLKLYTRLERLLVEGRDG